MKYMVVEHFKSGADAVYERYRIQGRMLPDGLVYVDSWLAEDGTRCYQVMETDDFVLFDTWIQAWSDLVDFEIVPIQDSPAKGAG